jgi:type I restriction enzyme, S subunit
MTDWKEYTLGELALTAKKAIISGPFGSNISSKFFVERGIPVIRGNNLPNDMRKFNDNGFVFITTEKAIELNCWAQKDDLLFTAAGTIGQVGLLTGKEKYQKYVISNKQIRVRLNQEIVDPLFAYYHFSNPLMNEYIKNRNTGSTIPLINLSVVRSLPITLPPLTTQTAIAEILSSLDDKIELNNQINRELEALAQALFKQWFVEFEFPNENGEPYQSSGGEMVDSELGEIPKGWRVKKISSVCEVKDGTHDSPKQVFDGKYLITSKHLKSSYIDFDSAYKISESDYFDVNKRSKVDKYDILITMIGTVGNLYFVSEDPNYAIKNIGLFKTSQAGDFGFFFYEYLNSDFITKFYQERLAGSTQQYLTLKTLRETPVLYDEGIISKYIKVIRELREQIFLFATENQSLIELRDTLLPKLISGELEVLEEALTP